MKLIQQIQQKRAEVTQALLQWLRQTRARAIFRLLAMRGRIAPLWVRHGWNLIVLVILIFAGASFALLPQSDSYVFVPRSDSTILAYLADAETIQTGRVAKLVEIGQRRNRRAWLLRSGGEVKVAG
ncbi:MAG: hypothetical protein ACREJ5_22130 [Geminicoccaceae bacterium]